MATIPKIAGTVSSPAKFAPVDDELAVKLVAVNLETTYKQHSTAFGDNPSADNWSRLIVIMHAWQFWRGLSPDRKVSYARGLTRDYGIGMWPSLLRDYQRRDLPED